MIVLNKVERSFSTVKEILWTGGKTKSLAPYAIDTALTTVAVTPECRRTRTTLISMPCQMWKTRDKAPDTSCIGD
jgi:hypothetical protein